MSEIPQFNHGNNTEIADFKSLTRHDRDILPSIKKKGPKILELNATARALIESDDISDERVRPFHVDQNLHITPFDNTEGMRIDIVPDHIIETWRNLHEYNLGLTNHPARIMAMKAVEERGFQPPQPLDENNIVEKTFREGSILQLSDLGHNVDMRYLDEDSLASWNTMSPAEKQQRIDELEQDSQVHRSEQFALGLPVMLGKQARSFFGGAAMPDINGSVMSLATQAMMHMRVDIPEVGYFSDPYRGATLAKAVFEYMDNHPILENYSPEDQEWLKNHWRKNVFGALEVGTDKALRRAEILAKAGVKSFRIYGHTQGGDVIRTTRAMRQQYHHADLAASQITDLQIAFAVWNEGADSIITGVGSGGRCTTADQAQSIPANALFPILARKHGFGIPIIAEGGAIDEPVIAALIGLSGVNGSGSIGGGTLESPGGAIYLQKDGKYYKPYGGEASPRTKWLSERTFPTGLPYFPEGDQTFKELDPQNSSIAEKVMRHQQRFILGPVMLRQDATPYIIEAVQNMSPSPLYRKSPTTFELQRTH